MIDKALLTGAFEKMGPERVQRALSSDTGSLRFTNCFLALAYGEPGQMWNDWTKASTCDGDGWFAPMGLSKAEFDGVWGSIDDMRSEFVALANEWLENRPVHQSESAVV